MDSDNSPEPKMLLKHLDVVSSLANDINDESNAATEILGKLKLAAVKLSDESASIDDNIINALYVLLYS